MLEFWLNVKNELDYKGMTQKELAGHINESYNTLQSWINKDRLPNVDQAIKIAKALDTSVEFLATGEDKKIKIDNSKTIKLLEEAIANLK